MAQIIRKASSAIYAVGSVAKLSETSSFAENGNANIDAKRKIHFINVTTEYLVIVGLKIPKYSEKQSELPIIRITPRGVVWVALPDEVTLVRMRYIIPQRLSTTPPIFFADSGSLSATAAISIVYTGESEEIIEQSIGVMRDIAIRKNICVRKNPSTAAAKIFI